VVSSRPRVVYRSCKVGTLTPMETVITSTN
jgi:hypothetical protein